ncbi:MAG: helix-turn-helix domain containing protein [Desulfovibrionaceae bacterium]|nr:helix-turn-helix domain containing protein [Desulfovibrionaceae bacterium]
MNSPLSRVFEAAECRTQIELASLLGIRQSSISDAKKRNSIPAEWLVTLLRLRGVNPEWILSGSGPRFLNRTTDSGDYMDEEQSVAMFNTVPSQDVLRHFSSRDLADELLRRAGTGQREAPPVLP